MSLWLLIPLLAFIAITQSTLLPFISIAGYRFDLALMVVVARGLTTRRGDAFVWGLIAGLFLDLISGLPFGTLTLALTLIGALTALEFVESLRGNLLLVPSAILIATLVEHLMILTILALFNRAVDWNEYLLSLTLPTAILNTLAFWIAYFPLQWLAERFEPRG
ncbi:MAG: rod shape-determining protein MreD [Chloroflexi bacterium]|nr:rod shape-determining protein MreD [Chloroflexota bacterium]